MKFIHEAGLNAVEMSVVAKAGGGHGRVRLTVGESNIRLNDIGSKERGAGAPMLVQGVRT